MEARLVYVGIAACAVAIASLQVHSERPDAKVSRACELASVAAADRDHGRERINLDAVALALDTGRPDAECRARGFDVSED